MMPKRTVTPAQAKTLRGLAHKSKPVVLVGSKGLTQTLIQAVDAALDRHELIKVRFNDVKEKSLKRELTSTLADATASCLVGLIGHVAIFYRRQKDPKKRRITLPDAGAS